MPERTPKVSLVSARPAQRNKSRTRRSTASLFRFDLPYLKKYSVVAGVDEAGRGPLAGPVVAAAVILPSSLKLSILNDSKQLSSQQRESAYKEIQRAALSIGVGIVESADIDGLNILQATYHAMRCALSQLVCSPVFILVDGYPIPKNKCAQEGIIDGDAKSACIAAASIVAKVTRDHLMVSWDRIFPAYGFKQHKGYGTKAHQLALKQWGPSPIHRRSFAPVRAVLLNKTQF